MRYDLESMLPERAFSPRGGRGPLSYGMTLEGGGKGGGGSAPAPDPNIGLAQLEMSKISREYLESWKAEVWPKMKEQAEKQDIRADEQFALDKELQEMQISSAKKTMAEFEQYGTPMRASIYKAAEEYDTAANRERIAAEALGDVKSAFGIKAADGQRRLQSFGIDPIKHGLLFFRFINPERNDFPDIDTDIQDSRRDEVKEYLVKQYRHVASIATFLQFKDKG